ncbi:MAG: O-antigen ligase family protein [Pseudomonadota bacterium]
MNTNLIKKLGTRQGFVGLLVFLLPFLSLVTVWGVSAFSFIIFISALVLFPEARDALRRHWTVARWVVCAFLFNFLFIFLCYLVRPEALLATLEKPLRMFLAVSALALVLAFRPGRNAMWWGVIGGAVAGALVVAYERFVLGVERPGGGINPITYGDMLMCLGLVCLAGAVDLRTSRRAIWAGLGALAGLAGTILTGTRGGWLALILAALLFVRYSHAVSSKRVRALLVISFALVAASYFVPDSGVRDRVKQGAVDVSTYFAGGSAFSNVGIRLELWKAASLMIAERPLLGADRAVVIADMERYVSEGKIDPVVLPMPHFHNDALQAMVTGGVAGALAWLSILVAPLLFFARKLRPQDKPNRQQFGLALAGILVVSSYFAFGLTEVIFWSVKGSLFYALMVFMLMGLCLNAKENDGK